MTIRSLFGHGWLALMSGVVYVISQSMIASVLHPSGADPLLLQFQFTYNATGFAALLSSITADQLAALQGHFAYDHIHPLWYGLLIVSLTAWLLKKNQLSARWDVLIWMGILPSVLDVIENTIHEPWFQGMAVPSDPLTAVAGVCATLKWSMAALYLLFAIVLGVRAFLTRHQTTVATA